jgi:peptide deformylase
VDAAVATIRRFGARCLRRRAEPVDPQAPGTAALRERLWATLAVDGGVGLAAPQIGVGKRVVVVRNPERAPGDQRLDLVNPAVVETFGPATPFEEGCLSFPGLYTTVMRPQGVVVEHDTDAGRVRFRDAGLVARIVQHEIDHLDGVLFIDHLSWTRRIGLLPRLAAILAAGWLERTIGKGRRPE